MKRGVDVLSMITSMIIRRPKKLFLGNFRNLSNKAVYTAIQSRLSRSSNATRPDTRPIPVADGWAGAEMRVFTLSNSITTDGQTDGRTDRRTDGLTDRKSLI